jgi:hypothetical protein
MALVRRRLRVFVSSAATLSDEREAAREAIDRLGLTPVLFEVWGARDLPIREAYLSELRSSDVYLGLFGAEWSDPTEEEFVEASKMRIPRLVYVRAVRDQVREVKLRNFIRDISNPQQGLTYKNFSSLSQLKMQVHDDLVDYLCDMTLGTRQAESVPKDREFVALQVPLPSLEEFDTEVNPSELRAGERLTIGVTFSGTLANGLLSAHLAHEQARIQFWAPNGDTWNPFLDTGLLGGPFRRRHFEWVVGVPPWMPPGTLVVSPGIWEDPLGVPSRGRIQLAVRLHKVRITETRDARVLALSEFYRRIHRREPDVLGLKDWFDSLVTRRSPLGGVLVHGFLKSVEHRVEELHRVFDVEAPPEDRARWVQAIQHGGATLEELVRHLFSVSAAAGALPSEEAAALREVATRLSIPVTEEEIDLLRKGASAAREGLLPFGVVRLLNDDRYIVREILRLRDATRPEPSTTAIREAGLALRDAQDRDDFFWHLWEKGWPF